MGYMHYLSKHYFTSLANIVQSSNQVTASKRTENGHLLHIKYIGPIIRIVELNIEKSF